MKKLMMLRKQLSKSARLNTKQAKNVKGGRRFTTKNYRAYQEKLLTVRSLYGNCTTSEHDGVYCIEW